MRTHKVKQGECLASIAEIYGLSWRTIYDHPENKNLREQTDGNPNVLEPGTEIIIPLTPTKSVSVSTGKKHRFYLKKPSTFIRLNLRNEKDQPISQKKWSFSLGLQKIEGVLDENGRLEIKIEDHQERQGILKVWLGEQSEQQPRQWTLNVGHLDPINTVTGVQTRLRNLGYYSGAVDGDLGPRTKQAIKQFQRDFQLQTSGETDSPTLDRLKCVHRS